MSNYRHRHIGKLHNNVLKGILFMVLPSCCDGTMLSSRDREAWNWILGAIVLLDVSDFSDCVCTFKINQMR